jgi:hypothetical protein
MEPLERIEYLGNYARWLFAWIYKQLQSHGQPWPALMAAAREYRWLIHECGAEAAGRWLDDFRAAHPARGGPLEWLQTVVAGESANRHHLYEEARLCALKVTTPKGKGTRNAEFGLSAEYLAWYRREDELVRSECSDFINQYREFINQYRERLHLAPDHFAELVKRLALDEGAGKQKPDHFLCVVILHEQRRTKKRIEKRNREREGPRPEELDALYDPGNIESTAVAEVDWDRGRRLATSEQQKALQAVFEGVDLQGAEAPEYLGWNPEYLDSIRRSLEPDRPHGRRLRRYFQAYEGVPNRAVIENKAKKA